MHFYRLLAAIIFVFTSDALAATEASDDDMIKYTVNEFITGIREGDTARIAAVANLEHGHAIWPQSKDGVRSVISVSFGKLLEGLQAYEGYGQPHNILSINIIGDELAVANIAANAPQADKDGAILEYFVLAKMGDAWQVIGLHWISRPGMRVTAE